MTVRATFTFRNQGGAPATGVRVRFNIPEGLVYLVGSGQLDGEALDDELGNSPLLARAGAHIGDVQPGEERRIDLAYSVAGAIENGSTVELQAAVASFELAPVGSNVVRLIARSKPQLENALTNVAIDSRHEAVPGGEAQVTIRVHNAGESSAHDVVVVAPIPANTTYLANSVRVNGREIERELGTSFDRVHAPVIVPLLAASATATLVYRVRIDDPLPDGTPIVAHARLASQETPAFDLDPASLSTVSSPDFSDDRTTFTATPTHDVVPGSRVALRLQATNTGTAPADRVSVTLELPEHLHPVRGASRIDGHPIRGSGEKLAFKLGRIGKHETVELETEAVVASPLAHGESLPIALALTWEPHRGEHGRRRFERSVVVRSEPCFAPRRNTIGRCGDEVVHPGDEIEATVLLTNDGSAAAHDATLTLRIDPALEEVRVFEKSSRLPLEEDAVALGSLDPYEQRRITMRARVRAPYADRSELHLGAGVSCAELGEIAVGEATWRVDSHPAFSLNSTHFELASDAVLRPNQLADVFLAVRNEGSDTAHDVRVRLYVSPEARLENVEGATRERSTISFGEIPPGGRAQARLGLRLLRGMARTYPVTMDAVLTAESMLPVPLERLTIETTAEPDFGLGIFKSEPAEVVEVGEMVEWTMHVRNGGDGPARHVHISLEQPESLIYVPNSTTVNDLPVRDIGALSPLVSERGIVFNDVDPGVEATIRWRDVVHNGLPAGEAIARVAYVQYDGERRDELPAPELHVRATPQFANTIPGLPFGVDGMLGPSLSSGRRALADGSFVELPPATPVGGELANSAPHYLALDVGNDEVAQVEAEVRPENAIRVGTLAAFSEERLGRTLRFLDQTRFSGLVTHLFALRALLPTAIGDQHGSGLAAQGDTVRETLDRLFIKLRLPSYAIAEHDLETPSTRASLERYLDDVVNARGTPDEPPGAVVVLRGETDVNDLRDIAERVVAAPLASAVTWSAVARLLPNGLPEVAAYRTALTDALDDLTDAEPAEFLEVLQHREYPNLDAALTAARDATAGVHV